MQPEPDSKSSGPSTRRKPPAAVEPAPVREKSERDDPPPKKSRRRDFQWQGSEKRLKFRWTPWLVLRANDSDQGARPLPAAIPFWESPDIWVESSDPAHNPVADEPNFVHARVFNLGLAPGVPLKVEFYWTDPTLGFSAGSMVLIGTEWVEVEPLRTVTVRCSTPWIPVYLNGGHECLIVQCSNAILDPIQQPFQPTLDRHVGQRNVTVIQGSPGTGLQLPLWIYNPWRGEGSTFVSARAERFAIRTDLEDWCLDRPTLERLLSLMTVAGPGEKGGSERSRLPQRGSREGAAPITIVPPPGSTGSISAKVLDVSSFVPNRAAGREYAQRLMAMEQLGEAGIFNPETWGSPVHAGTVRTFQRQQLLFEFGVPYDARRGEVVVHRLAQATDQLVAGGHTIVIEVV